MGKTKYLKTEKISKISLEKALNMYSKIIPASAPNDTNGGCGGRAPTIERGCGGAKPPHPGTNIFSDHFRS